MNKKAKIISTAYRVLLLIKLLNENDYTIEELADIFLCNPNTAKNLSKEAILKYIYTLRLAGYSISKPSIANNHKYRLTRMPEVIKLNEEELNTLVILERYIASIHLNNLRKNYDDFFKKISKYLSEEQLIILNNKRKTFKDQLAFHNSHYSKHAALIKKAEQLCLEERRVIVKYINPLDDKDMQMVLDIKAIKFDSKDVYIAGHSSITGEKQLIHMSYIQDIKSLPAKAKGNAMTSSVIFKLKDRVAKGYRLYEDEKITQTDTKEATITVTSYIDDKDLLFRRLLRYGDYCEIIYPAYVRNDIVKIIHNTLKNYQTSIL